MKYRDLVDGFSYTINTISTTSLRIYISLVVIMATAFSYLLGKTEPNELWLGFLLLLCGLDIGQFVVKRVTTFPPNGNGSTATTDIKEIKG